MEKSTQSILKYVMLAAKGHFEFSFQQRSFVLLNGKNKIRNRWKRFRLVIALCLCHDYSFACNITFNYIFSVRRSMQLVTSKCREYDDRVSISFQREIEILRAVSVNSLLIRTEAP